MPALEGSAVYDEHHVCRLLNYKDFPAAAMVAEMTKEGRTASL
jgi:hypothetical protein